MGVVTPFPSPRGPVTQIGFGEDSTGAEPDVSIYFGSFVASAASSRTATITYDDASGNGYAALIRTTALASPRMPPVDTRRAQLRPLLVR